MTEVKTAEGLAQFANGSGITVTEEWEDLNTEAPSGSFSGEQGKRYLSTLKNEKDISSA